MRYLIRCGSSWLEDKALLLVPPSELGVLEMDLSWFSQLAFRTRAGQSEPRGCLGNSIPDSGHRDEGDPGVFEIKRSPACMGKNEEYEEGGEEVTQQGRLGPRETPQGLKIFTWSKIKTFVKCLLYS